MIVITKNSTYEIEDGKIRCLETKGSKDTGITEEWREFSVKIGPRIGESMIIMWLIDDDQQWSTRTSAVQGVENDDESQFGWVV